MNQMQVVLAQYVQTISDISARLADAAVRNATLEAENVSLMQQIADAAVNEKSPVTADSIPNLSDLNRRSAT